MTAHPFKSPKEEAAAVDRLLSEDLTKKLGTHESGRIAAFKSDAMKAACDLRLLTNSHRYSHHGHKQS